MGHWTPQLWGAYQVLFPHLPPHPILPCLQVCLGNFLLCRRARGQLERPAGTWEPIIAFPALCLTKEQSSHQPILSAVLSASGQLQEPINLAVFLSLPAAPQDKGNSCSPDSWPARCQPGARQSFSALLAAGPSTSPTSMLVALPGLTTGQRILSHSAWAILPS